MRDVHARALNKHDTVLKELTVDQHVKIMVPPNRQEAIRHGCKAKHLCSWRGPMRIIAIEGTRFYLECEYDSKVKFERHLTNIRKWNGPVVPAEDHVAADAAPYQPLGDVEVGQFIFAKDKSTSDEVRLAKVTKITEDKMTVEIWGTRGRSLKTAVFKPVYTNKSDVFLHKPKPSSKTRPWTFMLRLGDFEELVILYGFEVLKSGRLTAATVRVVQQLTQSVHHHHLLFCAHIVHLAEETLDRGHCFFSFALVAAQYLRGV
jgi:hypothetical protein